MNANDNNDPLTGAERAAIVRDAYNRRLRALKSSLTSWAVLRDLTITPADEGDYSIDVARGPRHVIVRLFPSWEQEGPAAPAVIVESDEHTDCLRMIAYSGDSGMPSAAALKGLLTGLLFPEDLALNIWPDSGKS